MNIDSETLDLYKKEKSSFATALNNGINYKKSKFKIDKNKRCAFLNEQGLCEIILNLGEQNLCQVCRDHPRFRSFFTDRIETGLGFCCEEATRQILSFENKIEPVLVKTAGKVIAARTV
jgi:lysine-N-methylase